MIIGVGTDIVQINRFAKLKKSFLCRIFTHNELNYCVGKKLETIAGIFAAKESVFKSLPISNLNISLCDIEILHNKNVPYVKLHNGAYQLSQQKNIQNLHVSISHSKIYATAFAIAES